MRKIMTFLLALAVLCGSVLTASNLKASAESLYIRKIVSVVYDDSGSMSNNDSANWAYANYALQSFCGLLNSDDQLYITYMSDAEKNQKLDPERIELGASDIQDSVDDIREHKKYGNTPYSAIDIAFNKLKSVDDSNVNTKYWLVVITDGKFQTSAGTVSNVELNGKLNSCLQAQMPNGSTAQISYLAIGENAPKPAKNESAGLFVYESDGAADIVKTMSEIADAISGRSRLASSDVVKKDSKTIQISSSVPLLNMAVLVQKTSARISSVSGNGSELSIAKSANIRYPERAGWVTDNTLTGGTFLINNGGKNIPAGTYQIEFDGEISLDDVVIMFEPALEIRMSITVNGREISDLAELASAHENDTVDISCKLYETGTDNEISPSLLPPDTVYKMSVTEDGKEVQVCTTTDMKLPSHELHSVSTKILASVHIKGFNPITLSSGEFTPKKSTNYSIEAEVPDNYSLTMSELKVNDKKIYFIIYADGIAVDAEAAKSLPFNIDTKMPGKLEYESDGRISFLPMYQDPVTAIPTGDVEITGTLQNVASKTVKIHIIPINYTIKAVQEEIPPIYRTELSDNKLGVRFELFADGEKLDKAAVEASDIKYSLGSEYAGVLSVDTTVGDDGTINVIPVFKKWSWLAAYLVPTGTLEITASLASASDMASIIIDKDAMNELIWNWIVPGLILLIIIGEVFKRRFKYSSKIHYNRGESTGSSITGPISGWVSTSLFTPMALIPFVPDVKRVNGVKFYARGFFWNASVISVKTAQHPQFSGTLTDDGINELKPVRFSKLNISQFENSEKSRDMVPGETLVTSADQNYRSCQIYLYSDD